MKRRRQPVTGHTGGAADFRRDWNDAPQREPQTAAIGMLSLIATAVSCMPAGANTSASAGSHCAAGSSRPIWSRAMSCIAATLVTALVIDALHGVEQLGRIDNRAQVAY